MGTEEIPQSRSEHSPQPNPALTDLEIFVGKWEMEVSNASFLPDPSDTIQGHVSIEWLEDGAFLVLHQGEKSDPPFANWLISRDESVETYQIFYFDNRGVSRIYQMSFNDGD